MLALKELLSYILLPPANLALAIFVGWLLLPRRPCLGRRIIGVSSVLLLLLGMPIFGDTLLTALEWNLPLKPPADAPPGAIVILAGNMAETAGSPHGYMVGGLTLQRLRAGAALYRKTHLPILVSGGKLDDAAPPIAQLMADSLEKDFNVPVRWIEPRSKDTWQNAVFSARILRAAGIRSVYLVTHAWHEKRAILSFRRAGMVATAAPTRLDYYGAGFPGDIMPLPSVWQRSYFALHEWLGYVWYSLP